MEIEKLLEKYFEGTTSCEEERLLRQFFSGPDVPPGLESYRPLFVCLEKEIQQQKANRQQEDEKAEQQNTASRPTAIPVIPISRRRMYYWYAASAVALVILCVTGIHYRLQYSEERSGNYVIINGERYNDPKLVQAKAIEALQIVGFSDEELHSQIIPDL